jgi:hypothetical protein
MRSKNYKPVSAVLAASLLAATPDAPAFEIKPIGCRGAEGSDVNTETLAYLAPGMGRRQCGSVEAKVSCNDTYNYLVAAMANQPVHEAITRMAYRLAYKRPLDRQTWVSPLLSGVLWNDDPGWMLRKVYYDHGSRNVVRFVVGIERAEENPDDPALLARSHYGNAQFLHSMSGRGESRTQAVRKMHAWTRAAHDVYLGKTRRDDRIADTPFAVAIGEVDCGLADASACTVGRLLDREQRFQGRNLTSAVADENVRWLAVGTVLHILQDAHSGSHTQLGVDSAGRTWRELSTYDEENRKTHCEADAASTATKANIAQAVAVSAEYLRLVQAHADWSEVEALLNRIGLGLPVSEAGASASVTQPPR